MALWDSEKTCLRERWLMFMTFLMAVSLIHGTHTLRTAKSSFSYDTEEASLRMLCIVFHVEVNHSHRANSVQPLNASTVLHHYTELAGFFKILTIQLILAALPRFIITDCP